MLCSELLADVRICLGEPTAEFWSDAALVACLNWAARQFSEDSGVILSPPVTTSSQADAQAYSLPAECAGPNMINAVYYNGEKLDPSVQQAIIACDGDPAGTTGTPTKWFIVSYQGQTYLALYPIPESAITAGIKVWYSKIADKMSYDGEEVDDVCEISDDFCDAVVFLATSVAYAMKHDEESIQRYKDYYNERLANAQGYVQALIIAGMKDRDADADDSRSIF